MNKCVRRLLLWVQALWGIMAAAAHNRRLWLLFAVACVLCLGLGAASTLLGARVEPPPAGGPFAPVPLPIWQKFAFFALGAVLAWPLGRQRGRPMPLEQKGEGEGAPLAHGSKLAPTTGAMAPLPQGAQSLLAILARALSHGEVALFLRQEGRLVCRAQEPAPFGAQALGPKLMAMVKKSAPHALAGKPVWIMGAHKGRPKSIAIPLANAHEAHRSAQGPQKIWAVLVAQRQHGHLSPADSALAQSVAEQIAMSLSLEQALRHAQADKVRLEHMATTDGLTELANRRHFMRIFDLQLARAMRYKRVLSLIFLDIDHFKEVNDTFGHAQGDEVLKKVAQILKSTARKTDTVARYGGEEFAILMEETSAAGARRIAERIQEALKKHAFGEPNAHFYKTVSVGVACYPEHGNDPERLIACADEALYQAKRNGRNQITFYLGPKSPLESEP